MNRILWAGAACVLVGCGPKEETTVVTPPQTVIKENKTIINPTTTPTPKTIVVKKPVIVRGKETKIVENKKTVIIEKQATPAATPKPQPRPTQTAKPNPRPAPVAKAPVRSIPTPRPLKTATPKPAATPANVAASLVVRGTLVSTSKVPEPSTVAYSQSLVFSKYRVDSVEKGRYAPKEILVAQWGMKNKKLTAAARMRAGDAMRLELVPLSSRPDLEKAMRNDDTNEYDLEPYFAVREG